MTLSTMVAGAGTSVYQEDTGIVYEFSCTVCEKKKRNVEAIKRCTDCGVNLCRDCLVNHNLFPAMKDHSLINKQEVGKSPAKDLPRVKCDKHPGNRVELYCEEHDDVGCATCGNVSHKSCKDMQYIPDVAAGIKATSEPRDAADFLGSLVNRTTRVKQARKKDMRRVTTQRDTAVENIKERIDAIKQRLNDFQVSAIAAVKDKSKELEHTISCDINRSGDLISKLEKEERRLKAAQNEGESDLFVYMKQSRAEIREDEKVVQELEKLRGESLNIVIDDTVLVCATGLETFVEVGSRPAELSLAIEQRPNVRMKDDKKDCLVTDCCFMDNGIMLLTDLNNECVKLFDKSYAALDRCNVQGEPTAVCVVAKGKVAIALLDKKTVQFATVDGKIRLTRSFSVGENCRGASYSNNRLIITCGGLTSGGEGPAQMRIYDTSGDLLQTSKHDNLDMPLHSMPTRNGGYIVANKSRGMLAFDNAGKIAWQCQHADLKHAIGLCEVDDWVLVCCFTNGHVFQVNPADQSSRILLRGSDELKKPRSLTYDMHTDKLIITMDDCDHVLVYKISIK